MIQGAMSNLKLLEIEEILPDLDNGPEAQSIRELVATARQIQANCQHRGWARSDNLYLECGDCGAKLTDPNLFR